MSGHLDLASFQLEVDKRQAALKSASRKTRNMLQEVISLGSEATLFRILVIGDAYRSEMLPRMHLRLETEQHGENGEHYQNGLDNRAVVALWDGIVESIRPRP